MAMPKVKNTMYLVGAMGLMASLHSPAEAEPTITTSQAVSHTTIAANFLAARQALYLNDLGTSADFYLAALQLDNGMNGNLLRQSFLTQYQLGNIDAAAALARRMQTVNITAGFTSEPTTAQAIKQQDWDAVLVLTDHIAENMTAQPIAAIIRAWTLVAKGQAGRGLAEIQKAGRMIHKNDALIPAVFLMQAAKIAQYSGNIRDRDGFLRDLLARDSLSTQITLQLATMLAQLGDQEAALRLVTRLPNGFNIKQVTAFLANPPPPPSIANQIATGIVDASVISTGMMARDGQNGQSSQAKVMLTARLGLALYLDPDLDVARFLLAQTLSTSQQIKPAQVMIDGIADDSIWSQPRLLLRLDIERRNDINAAIERLKAALAKSRDNAFLLKEMGDLYRMADQFAEARNAYLASQKLGFTSSDMHRSLGIAYERLDQDGLAETSFMAALAENPNDPFTLNYIGYWWADEGRNLEQAIKLIERAVRLRPKSGYFVDSLGWVHFKIGNNDLAVAFLEQATILEPADAIITDHLGDAYWQAGRQNEARFKWRYALQLANDTAGNDADTGNIELKTALIKKLAQ